MLEFTSQSVVENSGIDDSDKICPSDFVRSEIHDGDRRVCFSFSIRLASSDIDVRRRSN
jgi:hypothetical protein